MTPILDRAILYATSAARSIRRSALRSALTALGIAVATFFAATASWVHVTAEETLRVTATTAIGADATWEFPIRLSTQAAAAEALGSASEVEAWSPFLIGRAQVRSPQRSSPVFVKGIVPTQVPFYGRSQFFGQAGSLGPKEVVLTRNVAELLGVAVGDQVEFPSGGSLRGFQVVQVIGTYKEHDADAGIFGVAYMELDAARALLHAGPEEIHGVSLKLRSPDWLEANRNRLEAASPLSKTYSAAEDTAAMRAHVGNLMLLVHGFGIFAVLIAAVGIGNTMVVLVRERVKEIATLKAVGLRPAQVTAMVLVEAGLLGAAGVVAGILLTLSSAGLTTEYLGRFLDLDLQFHLYPAPLAVGAGVGWAATLLAAWLPGRQAARIPAALAWQEGSVVLPEQETKARTREHVGLLVTSGALGGVYAHPLLIAVGQGTSLITHVIMAVLATFGLALTMLLLRNLAGVSFRIIGKLKVGSRGRFYLALHNLGWRSRRDALTAVCMTASILTVGLSGLIGPSLQDALTAQLAGQLGGEIIIAAPRSTEVAVITAAEAAAGPGAATRGLNAGARLEAIAGADPTPALQAALNAGKEYLADRSFSLQGMDLTGRRPPYTVVAGRDLTEGDRGSQSLLMLDTMATDLGIPLNSTVTLLVGGQAQDFTVVGLLKTEMVKTAYMRTSLDVVSQAEGTIMVYVQPPPGQAATVLPQLLRTLPREAFAFTVDEGMYAMKQILDFQAVILRVVSVLSLLAALLLIVNDVTVSVVQQRKELALMKVLGATPRRLLGNMAVQYSLLGLVAGTFGAVLAYLAATGIGSLMRVELVVGGWLAVLPPGAAVLAALVAAVASGASLARKPGVVFRG